MCKATCRGRLRRERAARQAPRSPSRGRARRGSAPSGRGWRPDSPAGRRRKSAYPE